MATKQITFDVQRIIAEVASRHQLLLRPDDAAFAIVTINLLVLEESLEAIHSRVLADLALLETAAQKMQNRAGNAIAAQVRESAAGIRQEIERDINNASLQASKIVQRVEAVYQQPVSAQKSTIIVLTAILLFVCGVWIGGISPLWWPL